MKCRVAIVDDAPQLRMLFRLAFEEDGRAEVVAEGSNGAEAVAIAKDHSPDVLLLDLAMPVMDGLEAIPIVRAAAPETQICVLSLSGRSLQAEALERGAHAYLAKDEDPAHVVDVAVQLCERSG